RAPGLARRRSAGSCAWRSSARRVPSPDVATETDRRLALDQTPRRHDQHAIVVGGAHLAAVVAADQCPLLRQHFEPAVILDELKALAGYRDCFGHLNGALPRMRVEVRAAERL